MDDSILFMRELVKNAFERLSEGMRVLEAEGLAPPRGTQAVRDCEGHLTEQVRELSSSFAALPFPPVSDEAFDTVNSIVGSLHVLQAICPSKGFLKDLKTF